MEAAALIEGKGESQHFALMVAKPERLAQLVFLDQLIDEVNRADAFHGLMPLGIARRLLYRHAGTASCCFYQ